MTREYIRIQYWEWGGSIFKIITGLQDWWRMEVFGLQNDYLDDAVFLATIIEKYFKNKVSIVTPAIDTNKEFPWYCVKFVLYRTHRIVYEYERGYFSMFSADPDTSGICILFSEENKSKFNNQKSDESTIIENLKMLDSEIRLRLPDKFLTLFD